MCSQGKRVCRAAKLVGKRLRSPLEPVAPYGLAGRNPVLKVPWPGRQGRQTQAQRSSSPKIEEAVAKSREVCVDVLARNVLEIPRFADELGQTPEGEGIVVDRVGAEVAAFCQPVAFYGIILPWKTRKPTDSYPWAPMVRLMIMR